MRFTFMKRGRGQHGRGLRFLLFALRVAGLQGMPVPQAKSVWHGWELNLSHLLTWQVLKPLID